MLGQDLSVPKDDKPIFGTSESNVKSSRIVKESNSRGLIAPDAWEENEIFLSALETVDGGHFNFFVELWVKLAMSLHVVHYESSLAFVRCNDANLIWAKSSVEKGWDDLLDIFGFLSVEEWGTRGWYFLAADLMIKEHRFFLWWPWEFETVQNSVLFWDTILERTFVECQRWKITEAWMHPVLHLQSYWSDTKANEPFK